LWARLNPFSSKPKSANGTTTTDIGPIPSTPQVIVLNSNAPPESPPDAPVVMRRYEYQFPPKPPVGNRIEAQKLLVEANQAQQGGLRSEAIAKYKKAAQADPASYEAHYNLALAAYGAGYWDDTLSACEHALTMRPESVDARFWFALALREAKFPQDAADQLVIILQSHPDDFRVHLSLANIYARQLNQPQLAREHYVKVLELSPNHPEASKIRFWLAGNPPK
jgi:tetratricopeptide (TPR) repeat protein